MTLTSFIKFMLFIDLIRKPTLKLDNFSKDCYFLMIFYLKFSKNKNYKVFDTQDGTFFEIRYEYRDIYKKVFITESWTLSKPYE